MILVQMLSRCETRRYRTKRDRACRLLSIGKDRPGHEELLFSEVAAESYAVLSGIEPGGNCSRTDGWYFTTGDLITM
jgi:hypothetical protein